MDLSAVQSLLRGRRTIATFRPGPVPEAWIEEAVASAILAPNHHRTEPWDFLLPGPETVAAIVDLNVRLLEEAGRPEAAAAKRERWARMPGWLVLLQRLDPDPLRRREDYAACACAAQNLMLELHARGLGSKWTTGAVTRDPRFLRLLGRDPETWEVVGLFWYGWPEERPPARRRRGPAEVLHRLP